MTGKLANCTEVAGKACAYLAERWRRVDDATPELERHNLEMATIIVLNWIVTGSDKAEANFARVNQILKR